MKPAGVFVMFVLLTTLLSCTASQKSVKKNILTGTNNNGTNLHSQPETGIAPTILSLTKASGPLAIPRDEFVGAAKNFLGTPYRFGSAKPAEGFDCSGFLYYLLQQFGVKAPRNANDYLDIGEEAAEENAKPGDLILFNGTQGPQVGHIGILVKTGTDGSFIHASSSKGVIISPLSAYWRRKFIKIARILR